MSKVKKKEHKGIGNKNASKGRDGNLNIRCSKDDKSQWLKKAKASGQSMTEWIIDTLNKAKGNN